MAGDTTARNKPLFRDITADDNEPEITEMESLCMNCEKQGITRLFLTKIPFFREVIVSSFSCDHCGFHNSEVQSGGRIQDQGVIYSAKIITPKDLNREVVQTEYAIIRIPVLDFEAPSKRGTISTVEGILTQAITDLEQGQETRKAETPDIVQECLNVTKFQGRCYAKNKYVRVLNNRGFLPEKFTSNITASYDCKEATDAVNGAYSPMLDALFYGTIVGRMFEEWYNMTPLSDQMQFRVHFGKKVSNAYWNGNECQFGDGDDEAYPFVTVDLVGHEVAHGITEQNSKLLYFQESGGINEAFSDICGETAEAYLSEADWVVGAEIMKGDTPMRFFENPEDNNESISHVRDFTDNMDPHDSSGVYNRVFYVLVNDFNIPIKNAFHAFLHANQMYWHHMTTFASGACDVLKAAYDLGQNVTAFRQAFQYVGINFDTCNIDSHVLELRNDGLYENITVSQDVTPMFTFAVPGEYAGIVTVNATSSSGDVTITLTDYDTESDELSIYSEGLNFVEYDVLEYSHIIFGIILTTSSETPLTDVTMVATFGCRTDFLLPEDSPLFAWKKKLWSDNCS